MKARTVLLALGLLLSTTAATSCGAVMSALPHVIAAVQDGMQIIDLIEQHASLALAQANADPATRAKVYAAIARAKVALNAALRTAQGAEQVGHLDQANADAAFANFKEAYVALLEAVAPFGVREETGDGKLSARASVSGTTLSVPRPEALGLRIPSAQ